MKALTYLLLLSAVLFSCEKPPNDVIDDPLQKDQYFVFSIGGLQDAFTSAGDSISALKTSSGTSLYGKKKSETTFMKLSFTADAPGSSSPASDILLYVNDRYYVSTNTKPTVFVSESGGAGVHIKGTYNGQLKDSLTGMIYTLDGVFRMRRN